MHEGRFLYFPLFFIDIFDFSTWKPQKILQQVWDSNRRPLDSILLGGAFTNWAIKIWLKSGVKKTIWFLKKIFLVFSNFWASAPISTANSCMNLYFKSRGNFSFNTFCRLVPSARRYHCTHWYRFGSSRNSRKRAGSSKIPLRERGKVKNQKVKHIYSGTSLYRHFLVISKMSGKLRFAGISQVPFYYIQHKN